jgi:hypothetical protein
MKSSKASLTSSPKLHDPDGPTVGTCMTSAAKIAANRRNARRSTGPRTTAGKMRVRRNALRHGLADVVLRDPGVTAEVERMPSRSLARTPIRSSKNRRSSSPKPKLR